MQRLITFDKSELETWDELLSCKWLLSTTSEGEEHLLLGDICVTDAIEDVQFEVTYKGKHHEPKKLTVCIYQTGNTTGKKDKKVQFQIWKNFEEHFESCLKKVLKASDADNKLFLLKSFLWNKMTNELIKVIKTEKESTLLAPMIWQYTFKEPYFTACDDPIWGDEIIWGDANIRVDFSESKLKEAAQRWFTARTNYSQESKDSFGDCLLYHVYGTLTYKYSIPTNPDLINFKIEEMGRGSFLEELDKRFSSPSRVAIKTNLKAFLIDKFWIEDYRLPPTTAKILQELNATEKQKEQIANELETLFRLSQFPIDNYIEESKLQVATNALKKRLRNFNVRVTAYYTSVITNPFTVYEVACDFLDYHFTVTLNMKNKYVVKSFEIKVDSEEKTIFNTTFACCEGNDGEFVTIMSRYLSDAYMAKAFKRHIEYKVERSTGCEIKWRA